MLGPLALACGLLALSAGAAGPDAYRLGPEDQVIIRALELEDIPSTPMRIDLQGWLDLPLVGRVQAAGRTTDELRDELAARLAKYVREPRLTIQVAEYRSRPVSVIGAVNQPGVHQLSGPRRLIEVLSLAGGLKPDAGSKARITRSLAEGRLPLPGARDDESGQFSVGEVDLESLIRAGRPSDNILIGAHDVVSVPRAELVYVLGEVQKPGGFTLRERESMSLLQALALSEGLQRTASPGKARILRAAAPGASRVEVAVNLRKIMDGEAADVPLQPDDILFVPNNVPRSVTLRAIETAVQIGTGVVIFRR